MTPFKAAALSAILAFGATTALLSTPPAFAADLVNVSTAGSQSNLAVQGYDVIAYRTDAGPTRGQARYSATHDGATYLFANADNLATFERDPVRYVPAYGGFCAFGVAKGQKVEIDPEAYSVVDDVLYLNYNKRIQRRWDRKQDEYIDEADGNWSRIADVAASDL